MANREIVSGDYLNKPSLSAAALNADLVASLDVSAYRWVSLQVTGTWSGTLTFQGSNDDSTFVSVPFQDEATKNSATTTTANGVFSAAIGFRYLRVRMTAYTSGTASGTLFCSALSPGGATAIIAGTGSSDLGKAEDSAHASGDVGVMALGVRNDNAATTLTSADGKYSPIAVDSKGRVYVVGTGTGSAAGNIMVSAAYGSSGADGLANSLSFPYISSGGGGLSGVAPYLYNGATYDRPRNNVEGTALASAARTASTQSADLTNYNHRGVRVWLDVTAISATPSITLSIEGKDPASGKYVALLTGAAVTTVSTNEYVVYPGVTETANVDASTPLPRTWRVNVTHGDADSITYSCGYCLIV